MSSSRHPARPIAWLILLVGIAGIVVGVAWQPLTSNATFLSFDLGQILFLGILWAVVGVLLLLFLREQPAPVTFNTEATGMIPTPAVRTPTSTSNTSKFTAAPDAEKTALEAALNTQPIPKAAVPVPQVATFPTEAPTVKIEPLPNTPTLKVPVIDNLELIEGIGEKVREVLNKAGITTFAQLAKLSADDLTRIVKTEGKVRIVGNPASWPKQARFLVEGDLQGFQNYVKQLTSGRETK
jgi:predicted flap endonuclease-1-like 5' DNA nuclease